jgi:hypothetical protein
MIERQFVKRWLLVLIIFWSLPVIANGPISKEKAVSLIEVLPEVKAWMQYLKEHSKEAVRATYIPDDKTAEIGGRHYWRVSFYESHPSYLHAWETFLVRTDGREILIENNLDPDEGPLSLEQWRKTNKPLIEIKK